jgi:hypothetical protein
MCDYSLENVVSRDAKVGDRLVTAARHTAGGRSEYLVWRFQNSNHRRHSKRPQFAGSKPRPELSGFMESVV